MLGAIQSDSTRPGREATKGKKYHIALRESKRRRQRGERGRGPEGFGGMGKGGKGYKWGLSWFGSTSTKNKNL